eukprot:9325753-Pyramimonas_sp.AAC.1
MTRLDIEFENGYVFKKLQSQSDSTHSSLLNPRSFFEVVTGFEKHPKTLAFLNWFREATEKLHVIR